MLLQSKLFLLCIISFLFGLLQAQNVPSVNRSDECGFRNLEGIGFRVPVVNSTEVQYGELPWTIAVFTEETVDGSKSFVFQCGGSLIHPKAVLTAAHCVMGKNKGKKIKIRAGEWDTVTEEEIYPHQDRDVETIIPNEHYRRGTLFNDIALMILKEPVELAENVKTLCLPKVTEIPVISNCITTGWGKQNFGTLNGILKKEEIPIVPTTECVNQLRKSKLGANFELHRSFICAGGVPEKDTCLGDGGSPLICPIPGEQERYYQAGIVSWGINCGSSNYPGVYTNVAGLKTWIDEQMQYQRLDASFYQY